LGASLIACHPAGQSQPSTAPAVATAASAPSATPASPGNETANTGQVRAAKAASARSRTVINPSAAEIVMLYYSLAGTRPPIERWVEQNYRLTGASAPDKAQIRADMRAELEALAASVGDVGHLRISLRDANLSTYDPAYGEFTIGALSPGSTIPFQEYGQKIGIRLDNAHIAQIWKIDPDRAREVLDKLGTYPRASIEVVLDVIDAVPSPNGGTITARIAEYEIHDARERGVRIVRNTVPES
jgi:hypothetical protein